MSDFGIKSGRFNAEYGFQSFPEIFTLNQFAKESEWNLDSEVMKRHQKSYVGNGMIKKHSDLLFGETTDFKRFVYYSQLTQAKAIEIAVSGHRISAPRCMGTLFWQVNDCWPAPSWSSVDFYQNWKAVQYTSKKIYSSQAILSKPNKENIFDFYYVNDSPKGTYISDSVIVELKVIDFSGKEFYKEKKSVLVDGLISEQIFHSSTEKFKNLNCVFEISILHQKQLLWQNNFVQKSNSTNKKVEIDGGPIIQLELLSGQKDNVIISIKTNRLLEDVWIYCEDKQLHLDKNFFTLLPGEIIIQGKSSINLEKSNIKIMSR